MGQAPAPAPSRLLPLALALPLGLAACGNPAAGPADVVAGDGVLCDLSRRLAGSELRVACLLKPGDDPHQFQLQPSHKQALASAGLVLINGYGLTPALARLPGAVPVAEEAAPDSVKLDAEASHHHGDGHNHGHGERDPHVWHDPRHAAAMARVIAERFSALRPQRRREFERRAESLRAQLLELHAWNQAQWATLPAPAPPLATVHRAFASLAAAYGLRELPLVDAFSSSDSLRPEALQGVLSQLRRTGVPKLFAESVPPQKALARISALSKVPIAPEPLFADGLAPGPDAGGNLMATLVHNTCTIVRGWGGRCEQAAGERLVERWAAGP